MIFPKLQQFPPPSCLPYPHISSTHIIFLIPFIKSIHFFLNLFFFWLFRATPVAYGSSHARGRMGATAAGLHHSHSNAGSEPHLRPTPELMATPDPNPLSETRDRTRNLKVPSWIRFHYTTTGTPPLFYFIFLAVPVACVSSWIQK